MSPPRIPAAACSLALGMALALGLGPAPAGAAESCTPGGPVSLMILQSSQKVRELTQALDGTVIRQEAKTVIFQDGRVITADVEAAGRLINELGWANRRIDVVASLPARRARPRSSGGG
jgi:hypothetical protein